MASVHQEIKARTVLVRAPGKPAADPHSRETKIPSPDAARRP